jgi:hypothetical protein
MTAALDLKVIAPVVYNRVRSGVARSAWHWQVTGVVSVCSFERGIPSLTLCGDHCCDLNKVLMYLYIVPSTCDDARELEDEWSVA